MIGPLRQMLADDRVSQVLPGETPTMVPVTATIRMQFLGAGPFDPLVFTEYWQGTVARWLAQ